MKDANPKSDFLLVLLLGLCCALPLLLLAGGGSVLAFITAYLTGSNFFLILAVILAIAFAWLILRRKGQ